MQRVATCAALCAAMSIVPCALAGPLLEESYVEQIDFPLAPGMQTVQVPQFDTMGGTRALVEVEYRLDVSVGVMITIENDAAAPAPDLAFTIQNGSVEGAFVNLMLNEPYGYFAQSDGTIEGSDGNAGSGPDFWMPAPVDIPIKVSATEDVALAPFIGAGVLDASVSGTGFFEIAGSMDATITVVNFGVTGSAAVTYRYTLVGGACCFSDGMCTDLGSDECALQGGAFQGPGTPCRPNPCPFPDGACCFVDGSCTYVTDQRCLDAGGTWQGAEIVCAPALCPEPTGACCFPDGSCLDLDQAGCLGAGGIYFGDLTACAATSCPQPVGACCLVSGQCIEVESDRCANAGGIYAGDFTDCASVQCVQPQGACCFANGSCSFLTQPACQSSGGVYFGNGTNCATVACPQPAGACCYIDGSCTQVDENRCNTSGGIFQGDFSPCGPMTCPQPTGACCFADGSCIAREEPDCNLQGGIYQGDGTTCIGIDCPQPNGACCQPDGSCTQVQAVRCATQGGIYQGNNTTCAAVPCPQPEGACCFESGSCLPREQADCATEGGVYQGDFTSCAGVNCPQPTGACCYDDGSCTEVELTRCTSTGGLYQGNGTVCRTADCPQPMGACCFDDGSCMDELIQDDCLAQGGVYQGRDSACVSTVCSETQGACCYGDGSCAFVALDVCMGTGGVYQGDDVNCVDAMCPGPDGACCFPTGVCSIRTQPVCAMQGGIYQGDATGCFDVVCPAPPGACCFANGSCTFVSQSRCQDSGGNWQGPDVLCAQADCPDPKGACCFIDGACITRLQPDCMAQGGIYQGDFTDCAVIECPQPEGACCFDSGACGVLEQSRCDDAGGLWQGVNSQCDELTCPEPRGACCLTDGECASKTQAECAALAGLYQGDLVTCPEVTCTPMSGACCLPDQSCFFDTEEQCTFQNGLWQGPNITCVEVSCGLPGGISIARKISATSGGFVGPLADGDAFGGATARLGDLDGNGVEDAVVGAAGDDDSADGAGALYTLLLDEVGRVIGEQKLSIIGFAGGLAAGDAFATSVAVIGDVDGNGVPDLAVGAPGDDTDGMDAGAVYIIFLDDDGMAIDSHKITSGAGVNLAAGDAFGASAVAVGDVDNDTINDLVIGAAGDDDGGADAGAVYVLFMNSDGTVGSSSKIGGNALGDLEAGDAFGASVAGVDDLNDDFIPDLAVGAPGDDDGGTDRGAVYVIRLSDAGGILSSQKLSDTAGNFGGALSNGDAFGSAVANPGDLNGMGNGDLAIGAPGDDTNGTDAGAVWIVFLDLTDNAEGLVKISTIPGTLVAAPSGGDAFGSSLRSVGDIDNNGVLDLAVGAPGDDDGGSGRGAVWLLSLIGEPDAVFEVFEVEEGVAGEPDRQAVGDIDGDGDEDLVVVIRDLPPGTGGAVQVFINEGNDEKSGEWLGLTPGDVILVGEEPTGIAFGEFSFDERIDIVLSDANDQAWILINDFEQSFFVSEVIPMPCSGCMPSAVAAGDFTEDGLDDFAVALTEDDTVVVFAQFLGVVGEGSNFIESFSFGTPNRPVAIEPEDLDEDRDTDLVVSGKGADGEDDNEAEVEFLEGGGVSGSETEQTGADSVDAAAGDIDMDGDVDFVTANERDGTVTIVRSTLGDPSGKGGNDYFVFGDLAVGIQPTSVELADFDGDGDLDIAVTSRDPEVSRAVQLLENEVAQTGVLSFSPPRAYDPKAEPNFVSEGDFDGDGNTDLATVNGDNTSSGGSVSVLINASDPAFTPPSCLGDVDGDGGVTFGDLLVILSSWGECPNGEPCPADLDGNDSVGFTDLLIALAAFGDCP